MPTRLDEIEVALHRQGQRWRIGHRDDYETLLALVAVARIAIKRRRNAIERGYATGEQWDMLNEQDLHLWEQQDAELAKLLHTREEPSAGGEHG